MLKSSLLLRRWPLVESPAQESVFDDRVAVKHISSVIPQRYRKLSYFRPLKLEGFKLAAEDGGTRAASVAGALSLVITELTSCLRTNGVSHLPAERLFSRTVVRDAGNRTICLAFLGGGCGVSFLMSVLGLYVTLFYAGCPKNRGIWAASRPDKVVGEERCVERRTLAFSLISI
ncbi:hypothetical protein EVAR_44628_1 [Eumeta japonica]|uniref:Uncharacterized protein n=1 Tax=Eumeta variegata TaxID=151549 RepID=A0A4C1Z1C1_EUMVA|nr:hypothetical protein EVAR_44628_1 [Eumeta japonica]